MTQPETTTTDSIAAKHQIHKIQDLLSLILAGACAIEKGDLEDDQGPAAGIAEVAEDARALLYDLMDAIGIDKEPTHHP